MQPIVGRVAALADMLTKQYFLAGQRHHQGVFDIVIERV